MTTTPQPDNEGNGGLTCTYDAWGRLVSVWGSGVSVSYTYDGLGRMVTRTDNLADTTTDYYYCGQQMLQSVQLSPSPTGVGDGSSGTLNNPTVSTTVQYIWSPRYVDSPIESETTQATYNGTWTTGSSTEQFYLTDANGNVTAVANGSGTVQQRYSYDAYGHATMYAANWSGAAPAQGQSVDNGQNGNPLQDTPLLFGGMYQDPTTGLVYDSARWYNPSTGDYLTRDPAQSDSNLYRYCGNDPVGAQDPTGASGEGTSFTGAGASAPATPTPQLDCTDLPAEGHSAIGIATSTGVWHVTIVGDSKALEQIKHQIEYVRTRMILYERHGRNPPSNVNDLENDVYMDLINQQQHAFVEDAIPPRNRPSNVRPTAPASEALDRTELPGSVEGNPHRVMVAQSSEDAEESHAFYQRDAGEVDAEVDEKGVATIPKLDVTDRNYEVLRRAYCVRVNSLQDFLQGGGDWNNPRARARAMAKAMRLERMFLTNAAEAMQKAIDQDKAEVERFRQH